MEPEPPRYHIYLLTVWQEPGDARIARLRFHLVDPQTGERQGFISPHALPFVLQWLRRNQPPPETAE